MLGQGTRVASGPRSRVGLPLPMSGKECHVDPGGPRRSLDRPHPQNGPPNTNPRAPGKGPGGPLRMLWVEVGISVVGFPRLRRSDRRSARPKNGGVPESLCRGHERLPFDAMPEVDLFIVPARSSRAVSASPACRPSHRLARYPVLRLGRAAATDAALPFEPREASLAHGSPPIVVSSPALRCRNLGGSRPCERTSSWRPSSS